LYSMKNYKTASLNYLKKAISLDKKFIKMAIESKDFENIINEKEFQDLISQKKQLNP
jgi:hypothetical protein